MKKNLFLSLLVMSVIVIGVLGVVSAAPAIGVEFFNPIADEYISGNYHVEWNNFNSIPELRLQYKEDNCDNGEGWMQIGDIFEDDEEYSWDTTSLNGDYCLRLFEGYPRDYSGVFTIDNEVPEIEVGTLNIPQPTEEDVDAEIYVDYSDNEEVVECWINWGDGSALEDCTGYVNPFYRTHEYADNGNYDITITVEDEAGNSNSDSDEVTVANVDPTIDSEIDGPEDVAVGQEAFFTADADDVDADLEAELTCVWTVEGDEIETAADEYGVCELEYTWTEEGTYTVDLTVEDKDEGEVDFEQGEIKVEEPEDMTPLQQVVVNENFEFDLNAPWEGSDEFHFQTSFTNSVDCELVSGPAMTVGETGTECNIDWTPTNTDKGSHQVIIRVEDTAEEYKYYSFDVTVYSWGIHLDEGWNLISIPYMPDDSKIGSVLEDIKDNIAYGSTGEYTIFQYDAVEKEWLKARPTSSWAGDLNYIVPGYGYWIKMDAEDWIYGVEEQFPINTVPGEIGIELATESWNLIGRFGGSDPTTALPWETALESLRNPFYMDDYVSDVLGIYKLDSVNSEGETTWSDATTIETSRGYWVRTAAGSEGRDTVIYEPDSI